MKRKTLIWLVVVWLILYFGFFGYTFPIFESWVWGYQDGFPVGLWILAKAWKILISLGLASLIVYIFSKAKKPRKWFFAKYKKAIKKPINVEKVVGRTSYILVVLLFILVPVALIAWALLSWMNLGLSH